MPVLTWWGLNLGLYILWYYQKNVIYQDSMYNVYRALIILACIVKN